MTKYLREIKTGGGVSDWIDIIPKGGGESMENVTVIGGVEYREVKRKAAVGERIKVVAIAPTSKKVGNVSVGEIFTVTFVDSAGDVWEVNERRFRGIISPDYRGLREYVVLEPITADASPEIDDIAAADVDLIVLQRELNGLKRQQAEFAKQIDGLTDAFARLASVTAVPSKPKSRDEIVAQAKRDVAELSTTIIPGDVVPTIDGDVEAFFPGDTDYVDFVVNRDKRTVVALIRYIDEKDVWAKGIAKCAPGDVFNSHIGRAIALRRALGLPVPTEYTHAPQPEGFSKGDVIEWASGSRYKLVNVNHPEYTFYSYAADETFEPLRYLDGLNAAVIDDSDRYESEVSA